MIYHNIYRQKTYQSGELLQEALLLKSHDP